MSSGSGALAWRLALRVGMMVRQQNSRVVSLQVHRVDRGTVARVRISRAWAVGLCVLVVAISGCGADRNGGPGSEAIPTWTVQSSPRVSIGAVDGASAYILSHVEAVRLLADNRIVVADRSSGTLRVYGADGQFGHQMGGLGEGPGEFSWLGEAYVWPPDTLVAYDADLFRLTQYLVSGDLISTSTFRVPDGYADLYLGRYSSGAYGVAWIKQVPFDRTRLSADVMRVARLDVDGTVAVLGEQSGMRRLGSPTPFSPSFVGVMVGDTVFQTDGLDGWITAIGPRGDTVRTFSVAGDPIPVAEAYRQLESALDSADAQRLMQVQGHPGLDTVPTVSDLLVDGQGRLWVKLYAPETDSHWVLRKRSGGEWLVLETDGTLVAHVMMPPGFRLMDIRGRLLAGVMYDDLGVEKVQVYEHGG